MKRSTTHGGSAGWSAQEQATSNKPSRATADTVQHARIAREVASVRGSGRIGERASCGQSLFVIGHQRACGRQQAPLDRARWRTVTPISALVGVGQSACGAQIDYHPTERVRGRDRESNVGGQSGEAMHAWERTGSLLLHCWMALASVRCELHTPRAPERQLVLPAFVVPSGASSPRPPFPACVYVCVVQDGSLFVAAGLILSKHPSAFAREWNVGHAAHQLARTDCERQFPGVHGPALHGFYVRCVVATLLLFAAVAT